GQPGSVVAAQRRPDNGKPARAVGLGQLAARQAQRQVERLAGAGRQLGALPVALARQAALAQGLRHQARLERRWRRPKTVQVQDHGAPRRARASSSLPCTPPKPPLLMTSTWSPGWAAWATAATRASRSS